MTMFFKDNPQNILGADNSDNQFASTNVGANADGSMIERLEYIQGVVAGFTAADKVLQGKADAGTDSTTVVAIAALAGYGDDFFNNQWYMQILHNEDSATAAPEKETRKITDYVSATGTFTMDAFSQKVGASDICLILHESAVAVGSNNTNNIFDSSSVVSNVSGSVLERLQSIQDQVGAIDGSANILGANDNDNGFDSSAVDANADGSIIERIEYLQDQVGGIDSAANVIGANDANNDFDSSSVVANEDGSVLERLEQIQGATNNGTGTHLATNKSLIDALGTDGSTVTDSAVSVLGAIGANSNNNSFDSSSVAANEDGSVLERLEQIQNATNNGSGTHMDTNKSVVDCLGTNGTAVTDSAVSVLGAIGANNNNNAFDSSTVVANKDGSVLERLEHLLTMQVLYTGTFTTSSATVPADTTLGAAKTTNDYYKGCVLMPLTGDCAFQPRKISAYTGTTGVFTMDSETPFTAATGAVAYVILTATMDTGFNTVVPATPTAGSLYDILSIAAGGNTFDKATDSLEAISNKITAAQAQLTQSAGLYLVGTVTTGASTTAIAATELAGFGNSYFNNKYYMMVIKDAGGAGAAPELQLRKITAYTSATGAFTTDAFANNVDVGDEIAIIHESLVALGRDDANNVFDSSTVVANADGSVLERLEYLQSNRVLYSGTLTTDSATVPADTTLGVAKTTNNYYNGCILMPLTGACAFQPRRIKTYTGTTGVMTLEPETPFTGAPGTVTYAILADTTITGFNTIVPASPTAGSIYDILSKAAGGNTFDKATDSLEAISEKVNDAWDAIRNGTGGLEPGSNRSIINEIRGSAMNYNSVNYLAVSVDLSSVDWNEVATQTVFTVTGLCRLRLLIECTENCVSAGGLGTMKLGFTGATDNLIAATSIDAIDVGEIWIDNSPTEQYGNTSSLMFDKTSNGIDVGFEIETAAATDGTIIFHCWWEPLNSTGVVAAGTGQALS